MDKVQMEDRLVKFAAAIVDITGRMATVAPFNHIADHLQRSAISAACHYGEVQSAESSKDFIHKLSVVLKELREAYILLRIHSTIIQESVEVQKLKKESDELIRIVHVSIRTIRSRKPSLGPKDNNHEM